MKVNHLTPDMTVSSQITGNDMTALKEPGLRTPMWHRPSGESTNQPLFAEIEIVAKRAGMGVFYLPVAPGRPPVEQTRQFGALLASQPTPVLAYCRSGMRSASMWALAQKDRLPPADIVGM